MPNWCTTTVIIEPENEEDLSAVANAIGDDFDFDRLIAIPEELRSTSADDWCWTNWGTKGVPSEVSIETDDDRITILFDTAWGFPGPIFERLSEMFPSLHFRGHAAEPNMCWAIVFHAHGGRLRIARFDYGDEYQRLETKAMETSDESSRMNASMYEVDFHGESYGLPASSVGVVLVDDDTLWNLLQLLHNTSDPRPYVAALNKLLPIMDAVFYRRSQP